MLVGDKQQAALTIWNMQQKQLCNFFTNYQAFPQPDFHIGEIVSSNNLKLVKKEGRIFFGEAMQGRREGKGIQFDKDGKIYEGWFEVNEKNGPGIEIYPNGNLYIGHFERGKKHGDGTFYWFNLSPRGKEGDECV